VAREIAVNADYKLPKNDSARRTVVERILSADPTPDAVIWDIVATAQNVFSGEVLPKIETRFAQQANALLATGVTRHAIAVQLGITTTRLSRVLREYSGRVARDNGEGDED
jgi:hypothetical protein